MFFKERLGQQFKLMPYGHIHYFPNFILIKEAEHQGKDMLYGYQNGSLGFYRCLNKIQIR